jgi:hypothetical protein
MAIKRKLPKHPKKPKASASLGTWERYDMRVKDWHKRCNEILAEKKKKETLIKKYSSSRSHLSVAHSRHRRAS